MYKNIGSKASIKKNQKLEIKTHADQQGAKPQGLDTGARGGRMTPLVEAAVVGKRCIVGGEEGHRL